MIRRLLGLVATADLLLAGLAMPAAPLQSRLLESNIIYLRVTDTDSNLLAQISEAEKSLTSSNQPAGAILDLRSADGDGEVAAKSTSNFLVSGKLPLAVLINAQTRDASAQLAGDLRAAKAGLIFGSPSPNLQPDIAISVKASDERIFLKDPYAAVPTNGPDADETTSNFVPYIDHTSEADLVREKIKDGDEDETTAPVPVVPAKPVIRDPVLARAVDFLKALAILQPSRG